MTELKAIELVDIEETNDVEFTENNNPAKVTIMRLKMDKFEWFLSDEFKKLRDGFTPVDNKNYLHQADPEIEAAKSAAASSASTADVATQIQLQKIKMMTLTKRIRRNLKPMISLRKKLDPMQLK